MQKAFTDLELLHELEPVVEANVHRHLGVTKDWNPHDYVPWSEGKNYKALGGQDWDPEQSKLSELAKIAMIAIVDATAVFALFTAIGREAWAIAAVLAVGGLLVALGGLLGPEPDRSGPLPN